MASYASTPTRARARGRAQGRIAARAVNRRAPGGAPAGSAAGPGAGSGFNSFIPKTAGGGFMDAAVSGITGLMAKFPKNKAIQNFGTGLLGNYLDTMGNTGLEIARNKAFLGDMGEYQSGMENLKTGNTMKLMGAEGAIAGELIGRQGIEQRAGIRETGEQERLGLREQGNQTLRLRGDARGAIRSQGARFYG